MEAANTFVDRTGHQYTAHQDAKCIVLSWTISGDTNEVVVSREIAAELCALIERTPAGSSEVVDLDGDTVVVRVAGSGVSLTWRDAAGAYRDEVVFLAEDAGKICRLIRAAVGEP